MLQPQSQEGTASIGPGLSLSQQDTESRLVIGLMPDGVDDRMVFFFKMENDLLMETMQRHVACRLRRFHPVCIRTIGRLDKVN